MKLVWITIESILPANSGGRIGIIKRMEQVAKNNEIYLFYTMDSEEDRKYVNELLKYCKEVHCYLREKKSMTTILNTILTPYTVASRKNNKMISDIQNCLDTYDIDIINVDSPHMGLNLLKLKTNVPLVLNQHNIEWKLYMNISKANKKLLKKVVYFVDGVRFHLYEKFLYKKLHFDLVTFVSEEDMEYFKRTERNYGELALVPVGANSKESTYDWENKNEISNIIFVGKMSYAPNEEAVLWFVNEVYPYIIKEQNVEFWIVGKDPTQAVQKLATISNVHVTGEVDSVEAYYEMADVVVIPLFHGGGVKIKLLEAIGQKIPVISTSVGIQGTAFTKKDLLISDSSDDFAIKCLDFLKNKENYYEMYSNLFMKLEEMYTWQAIGKNYETLLNNTTKVRGKR